MNKIRNITRLSVVAATYVALSLIFQPISFGLIQFRIAEVLTILVCINKKYTISLTLGCLIANIFSGMALDCLFGTLGTLTTCLLMCIIKNKYISLLASPIMNGLFVGFELAISFGHNFFLAFAYIAISQFVVVTVIGGILLYIIDRQEKIKKMFELY